MAATTIVLKAKLLAPPLPAGRVPRARLRERFEPTRPLTLVTAPAGFGKTLAVTEWLAGVDARYGWLSLDEGDNDAARFFAHVVAALGEACSGGYDELAKAADTASERDVAVLVARLTNQLHAEHIPFYLVLDDYHVIESSVVHQTVGFIVEHMPPTMRLVVTTRREPPLPLPRWRMRGQLGEVGERDLRFAGDEVASFLNGTMGLRLGADQVGLLERKTEGWVGGLQLAALSLVERAERDDFLAAFAGDDRYVMDYLTAEVLAGQPPEIQRFLLRTSVLERMNVAACEAVSGQEGCAEILARLERERVFVVALDGNRQWYRYHHLFAELLRHQLASSETERAGACHLAASAWYEAQGELAEAARHARLAGSAQRLGELVQTHGLDLATRGRSKQVLTWVRQLPEAALAANPERLRVAMWCEYARTGRVPEALLRLVESARSHPDGDILVESLAVLDAYEAGRDPARYEEAIELAGRVSTDPSTPAFIRLSAAGIIVACACARGDLETADARYTRLVADAIAADAIAMFSFTTYGHGRIHRLREGPRAARRYYAAALDGAAARGWDNLPVCAAFRAGLAEQDYESGNTAAAEAGFEAALSLAEQEPTTSRHPLCLALARLYHADGRHDACDAMLRRIDAEPYIIPLLPVGTDFEVARGWLELARGRLDAVEALLDARREAPDRDRLVGIHGLPDDAHLLLGRLLLLRQKPDRAIAVLTQLLHVAVAGGRRDTALRCRIDLALARYIEGERQQAFAQLDAAVDTALGRDGDGQPRGYHRVFVDTPAQFRAVLRQRLEAGVEDPERRRFLEPFVADATPSASTPQTEEPLSPSERRVLEHLVAGLSNKEIALRLFVSPNTIKTHIRRIYGKLQAKNRAEAIVRAQALGLGPG